MVFDFKVVVYVPLESNQVELLLIELNIPSHESVFPIPDLLVTLPPHLLSPPHTMLSLDRGGFH